ncbi:uncharacterized protein LOC130769712 [Actinidia eriantha]|uniref:uncharacterized protein LOC130769712 n=1 Tax=Actinidia eriantha TaxID=165200 RepID=UPI00258919A0|nr:uncharacterized protein LOC130769712 [Actinidia eriantha]XP_057482942.1 uncharacterized protein LOC130769712 [Actinidia eriantha]
MAGEVTAKLRLVRCPGCRGILPELAPVFQCARCGTVLQAKKRKNETTDAGSQIQETNITLKNELENVSDSKEAQSLSQEETTSSGDLPLENNFGSDQDEIQDGNGVQSGDTEFSGELPTKLKCHVYEESSLAAEEETKVDQGESSLEKNNGGDQHEHVYCNGKQSEGVSFSSEIASSNELHHHESEESSPVAGARSEEDWEQQNNGRAQDEYGYCNGKLHGGLNFSDELTSSTEINHHESEESSPVAGAHSDEDLEQNDGKAQNEYGYCNGKRPGGISYSDELASTTEINHHESVESSPTGLHSEVDENSHCLDQDNGRNQSGFGDYKREWPGNVKFSHEVTSSTELTCQEIEESSPVGGTRTEFDENFNRFIFGSLSGEKLLAESRGDSFTISKRPLGEGNLTDNQMSPRSEQLEHSQKRAVNAFDRVSSEDSLDNLSIPSPKFHVKFKDMPKFQTRSYYADDGSVSSYDGVDDRVSHLPLHLMKRQFKESESASTKGMPSRDEVMKTIASSYPELQHQAWNCSSSSSEKRQYFMKTSNWCQDELVGSARHGPPDRNRMKFEADEHRSREPFYSMGYQISSEKGSPSNYGNYYECGTSFHSPKKSDYLEEEKMQLLKMVYELQDQLNRTHIEEGKANGRFPGLAGMEKKIPSYYDHTASDVETGHDLNNTRYSGRGWAHPSRTSRIPFSAEATTSRHPVNRFGLHSFPQDWQCSAPVPPHICYNKSQYTGSRPYSPQHYTGSEFSLRFDDSSEMKRYSRERHHSVKRHHVLPVAGAAPFLVCYNCLELLHVPADFLLFRRKCHRLKCSACSVILKFSLRNRTQIVPYTDFTHAMAPPPSNVDDCSNAKGGKNLALASTANFCPDADPVSCSDDFGQSLRQSCSTDGEPFSVTPPLHSRNRESNDRKMSSGSSFEPIKESLKLPSFRERLKIRKNPLKSLASSGSSSSSKKSKAEKLSSEIEELPPKAGSPLHRLMGYSSARLVLDS